LLAEPPEPDDDPDDEPAPDDEPVELDDDPLDGDDPLSLDDEGLASPPDDEPDDDEPVELDDDPADDEPVPGLADAYRSLYQPPPLSWNAVREISRSSDPPHASQTVLGSSLMRCWYSNSWLHLLQRYS